MHASPRPPLGNLEEEKFLIRENFPQVCIVLTTIMRASHSDDPSQQVFLYLPLILMSKSHVFYPLVSPCLNKYDYGTVLGVYFFDRETGFVLKEFWLKLAGK